MVEETNPASTTVRIKCSPSADIAEKYTLTLEKKCVIMYNVEL